MKFKTMNTHELLPEFFYIFTGRNSKLFFSQVESHNIALRHGMLVSSGMNFVLSKDNHLREKYLKGDVDYLPFIPNPNHEGRGLNPFAARVEQRYLIEYNLERYRQMHCKEYPSRFSGVFAFGSMKDCRKKSNGGVWDIKAVKKYRLVNIDELTPYYKVIKANTQIIGTMKHYPFELRSNMMERVCEHYWSGGRELHLPEMKLADDLSVQDKNVKNITEYLIEGMLELVE